MIKLKSTRIRYLLIAIIGLCLGLVLWLIYSFVTRPRAATTPALTSVTVTVSHPDGSPLANSRLSITNFGYAWSGNTDKNGSATVPPQAISPPIKICAFSGPDSGSGKCDYSASIDESGKALESGNTLIVSLQDNLNE